MCEPAANSDKAAHRHQADYIIHTNTNANTNAVVVAVAVAIGADGTQYVLD